MDDFGIQPGITGKKTIFDCDQKHLVNFVTKCIAILFGKISQVPLPEIVGIFETQDYGD